MTSDPESQKQKGITLKEAMICWTPARCAHRGNEAGKVEIVRHGVQRSKLLNTAGACYAEWRGMTDLKRERMLMIEFNTLVVRDGIDPQAAHKAFLAIDEYRAMISPDMQGADP